MSWLTLVDPATLAVFMAAGIALNLTPGADVMFATACGAAQGWQSGVAAAAGISAGSIVHVALTAAGLAALLQTYPAALEAIRWAGAAYLAWLAWRSWQTAGPACASPAATLRAAARRGLLTNVLNPKVALFVLAFLPQFTDPSRGPVWAQIVLLGLVFTSTGFVITAAYGATAGALATPLRRHARALNRITATVYAALAARLVLTP
ncbi:LysE family translocator [Aestuariicoccus sp. MJ-SS9]|uniref:LysE family translocator n=1 Tax=Aestuariicoccus sp. MJ-SS9 TaxID=3079855 RepID=UPI002908C274|nr:LysE family translocator [Aestuariicoccus sp. MJ-SS9]MDU8911737.1 LysE family translocator [Aestuariicoccus sp. MJ-SS9]